MFVAHIRRMSIGTGLVSPTLMTALFCRTLS